VLSDVFAAYSALLRGEPDALPEPRQYRHYVAWLAQKDQGRADAFWSAALGDLEEATSLAGRLPRSRQPGHVRANRRLSRAASERLERFARERSLTQNTVLQGALALVLGRYTGSADVVFGVTVSGRDPSLPDVEQMVGLFINTLPLRVQLTPDAKVSAWLERLQLSNAALREEGHAPLAQIQRHARGVAERCSTRCSSTKTTPSIRRSAAVELGAGELETSGKTSYPLTLEVAPGPRSCCSSITMWATSTPSRGARCCATSRPRCAPWSSTRRRAAAVAVAR